MPIDSSTGPCSMWSSRYAAADSSCDRASRARSRSTPFAASASGSEIPSLSVSWRSSSWSLIDPPAAEEPKSERPKRAPSSSAQLTRRIVTGGVPCSASRRSASAPATTLRHPSSQPPSDRVDVTADQDGALRVAAQRPPVVAGGVALALERKAVEEAVEPRAGRVPRVRPRDALGAVLVAVSSWSSRSWETTRPGSRAMARP